MMQLALIAKDKTGMVIATLTVQGVNVDMNNLLSKFRTLIAPYGAETFTGEITGVLPVKPQGVRVIKSLEDIAAEAEHETH